MLGRLDNAVGAAGKWYKHLRMGLTIPGVLNWMAHGNPYRAATYGGLETVHAAFVEIPGTRRDRRGRSRRDHSRASQGLAQDDLQHRRRRLGHLHHLQSVGKADRALGGIARRLAGGAGQFGALGLAADRVRRACAGQRHRRDVQCGENRLHGIWFCRGGRRRAKFPASRTERGKDLPRRDGAGMGKRGEGARAQRVEKSRPMGCRKGAALGGARRLGGWALGLGRGGFGGRGFGRL